VKFFWKVFFTTMFISVISVILSGYLMINANFHSQLDSEVKIAQDYGEIVYYSLSNEFQDVRQRGFAISADAASEIESAVSQSVRSISISAMNQKITFGILDENQNVIFSSLNVDLDKTILSSLDSDSAGWMLKEEDQKTYIQIMRPVICLDNLFYIEIVRDVTHIFADQKYQYGIMIKILAGMIVFAGVLTFAISKLLLRRITALTAITKIISDGNLSERAAVRGNDEITLLSENFNQMADHLEEKIHELQEEAERKELFVGSFSHELKTPLTSIIGYSDLLRRKEMDAEKRHICAEYIFTEGKRLERLSMRLLDLIVLKKHEIHLEPVSVKAVLDEVRAVIMPQLIAAHIELVYDVEQAVIPMETELMKTVFINIADNARKSMERGGTIIIRGRKQADQYMVTIQDSGMGMEKTELEKITDAFYRIDKSRSRKQGGAGLGLAICNEILMLHEFSISFESTLHVGTAVTITMEENGT
jgi:signal transduction histidine kinase